MSDTYRVVFSGRVLPGHDRDTAIGHFARLLKRTPEQVAGAFGGKASVLKKGVSQAEAEKYCRALEQAGMQVHAEPEGGTVPATSAPTTSPGDAAPKPALELSLAAEDAPIVNAPTQDTKPVVEPPKISPNLALVEDDEQKAAREAAEAAKAAKAGAKTGTAGTMTCPACGQVQAKADVCESCHVVIAKFVQRQAEKQRLEAERAAQAAEAAAAAAYAAESAAAAKTGLLGKLFGKKRDE